MFILLCLTTLDGSQVNLKVRNDTVLEYRTTYGGLRVPLTDVRNCQLGVHPQFESNIVTHVTALGSAEYRLREEGSKYLASHLRDAQHHLAKAAADNNPERAKRASLILKNLLTPEPANDSLTTINGIIDGYITNNSVTGESESLGKLTIPVSSIKSIKVYTLNKTVAIRPDGNWHSAGYITTKSLGLTADGDCNMWPVNGQGNFVCNANGLQDGTMKDGYPAGCLIGRINGRVFYVGKSFAAANIENGELELRVVLTDWSGGQPPTGFYEVTIK